MGALRLKVLLVQRSPSLKVLTLAVQQYKLIGGPNQHSRRRLHDVTTSSDLHFWCDSGIGLGCAHCHLRDWLCGISRMSAHAVAAVVAVAVAVAVAAAVAAADLVLAAQDLVLAAQD